MQQGESYFFFVPKKSAIFFMWMLRFDPFGHLRIERSEINRQQQVLRYFLK